LDEFSGIVFWRIADGKIRECWVSVDLLGPLKEAARL
jgi:predicted ester cyclase